MRVLRSTRPLPSSRVLAAITVGLLGDAAVEEICCASAHRPQMLTAKMLKKILADCIIGAFSVPRYQCGPQLRSKRHGLPISRKLTTNVNSKFSARLAVA